MRQIVRKSQFRRDFRALERRGRDATKLLEAAAMLAAGDALPPNYRDHQLSGNWRGHRECHLGGDWLLIYQIDGDELVLVRTGTHSELFGK